MVVGAVTNPTVDALNELGVAAFEAFIELAKARPADAHLDALAIALSDGLTVESAVLVALAASPEDQRDDPAFAAELAVAAAALRAELTRDSLLAEDEAPPTDWVSAFAAASAVPCPELPETLRAAAGWAVLSDIVGPVAVISPGRNGQVSVCLVGASQSHRETTAALSGGRIFADPALLGSVGGLTELQMLAPPSAGTEERLRERHTHENPHGHPSVLRLVAAAHDAAEAFRAEAGAEGAIPTTQAALDRLSAAKVAVARRMSTSAPDIVDTSTTEFADLVRRMAALVAITSGRTKIDVDDVLAALASCEAGVLASIAAMSDSPSIQLPSWKAIRAQIAR